MSYHDAVMAKMREDPGRTWTSGELVRAIYPEIIGTREYQTRVGSIHTVLKSAAKYGLVERIGTGPGGQIWRLTE